MPFKLGNLVKNSTEWWRATQNNDYSRAFDFVIAEVVETASGGLYTLGPISDQLPVRPGPWSECYLELVL